MRTKQLLIATCLSLGVVTITNSQIINPSQPDLAIGPAPGNTGVALAPNEDIQAIVFDDGAGTYKIYWMNSAGVIVDGNGNPGNDPDVAYYSNADLLVVAYELGGDIYVDDYYLATLFPSPDYYLNSTTGIFGGQYPNVDMNSSGEGVLTWESGGDIWACSFTIGPFTAGPPTIMASGGAQPDIILLDDNTTVALTYIDFGGNLMISTYDFGMLQSGAAAMTGVWNYPAMSGYKFPRIAGQRNAAFGPVDFFTVVAQDFNGVGAEVHGFFNTGGPISGPFVMNDGLVNCVSYDPYPVVTYERDEVHVAWSQRYSTGMGGCASGIPGGASGSDVLMGKYDFSGGNIFGGPVYFRINQIPSAFAAISKNALNAEYDGGYGINNSNYNEAIVYNDPGDLFWKTVNAGNPSYIPTQDELSGDDVFTLTNSPVNEVIEVVSSDDAPANFELYDNAGRLLEVNQISKGDNTYSIDISHLSGGTYFLKCTSSASEEVLKVLQVNKQKI